MFARILYVCVYWVTIQTEQRSDDYVIRIPYAAAQLTSRPEITAISELRSNANEDSQSNSTHTRRDAPADVTSATNASVRFKMHYSAAASQEKSRQHRDENLSKREIKRAKKSEKSSQYKLYAKCVEHQAENQACEKMCETESVQILRKMRRASSGRSSAIAKFSSLPHHLQVCRTFQ